MTAAAVLYGRVNKASLNEVREFVRTMGIERPKISRAYNDGGLLSMLVPQVSFTFTDARSAFAFRMKFHGLSLTEDMGRAVP